MLIQRNRFGFLSMMVLLVGFGASSGGDRIQPYSENRCYRQYQGKPVLLLGGSWQDNLFNHPIGLERHLDLLKSVGGNYVRCTMSSRDSDNIYPYFQDAATQKYDLDRWNDEYWRRFDHFLKATSERNIIVQIEVWATYDFYSRTSHFVNGKSAWERNPFNPRNNINYDKWQTGLSELFESHGQSLINPFFNTTLPLAEPGRQYAVYFPDGGMMSLNISEAKELLTLRRPDIRKSMWLEPETVSGETLQVKTPGAGHWAAMILPAE